MRLHRQYCRHYGLNPATTPVNRSELLFDAAFDSLQTDGKLPSDRPETLLSAIYHCVFWTACAFGLDPDIALSYIGDADLYKPKKFEAPSLDEIKRTAEAKDRALFNSIKHKFT